MPARSVVLWDIDNCIADDEWRIPFIDWTATDPHQRYFPYHNLCSGDQPHNMRQFRTVHEGFNAEPCFITARPEAFRHMTRSWLRRHFTPTFPEANRLLMRADDDHSHSLELKRGMVQRLLAAEPGVFVAGAFDDRPDVVAMYRDHFGFLARVMAIHSTCAYTPPKGISK